MSNLKYTIKITHIQDRKKIPNGYENIFKGYHIAITSFDGWVTSFFTTSKKHILDDIRKEVLWHSTRR